MIEDDFVRRVPETNVRTYIVRKPGGTFIQMFWPDRNGTLTGQQMWIYDSEIGSQLIDLYADCVRCSEIEMMEGKLGE